MKTTWDAPVITDRPLGQGHEARPHFLYIVHLLPYVPSAGGLTRTFHLVRAAAQVADVTLVAAENDPSGDHFDMVSPLCKRIHVVPAPAPPTAGTPSQRMPRPLARISSSMRALARSTPFPPGYIDRDALCKMVQGLLTRNRFDAVVVEHTAIAAAVEGVIEAWGGASVAALQDVLSVVEDRRQRLLLKQAKRRRPSLSGWRLVSQLRAIERGILRSYARVVAVSEIDAAVLRRLAPDKTIDVVANGVDVDYFAAVTRWPRDPSEAVAAGETVIFVGSLWYRPNVDALRFFMADVWPLIRRRRPTVRCWIVGKDPAPEVQAMSEQDAVELFASVPDVRPYLAGSAVAVVPLRLGSGTRLKILEALAAGRPVVSTTLGAEGLDLEPGRDLLLADTPAGFAEAVVTLLERPDYAQELAAHGRETVRRLYSWDGITQGFQRLLHEVRTMRCSATGAEPRAATRKG